MSNNGPQENHQGIVNTTYVGPKDRLMNKSALVRSTDNPAIVEAQFKDLATGMSTGWHPMPRADFLMFSPRV